jgi:DNA-binding CsgD family transcriptional regulator
MLAGGVGRVTVWVQCTEELGRIPFGALGGILQPVDAESEPMHVLRLAVDQLLAEVGERGGLVVVDNAHLIDDRSAAVIHRLSRPGIFVLATASGRGAAGTVRARLFPSNGVEQFLVTPLGRDEVGDVLRAVLGGPVQGLTIERLRRATGGLPFFVHELVRGGVAEGRLIRHDGIWAWPGPVMTTTAVAAVEARLASLSLAAREALELIALREPANHAVVEAAVDPTVIELLEDRELVAVEPRGEGYLLHASPPIAGDVIRARISPVRRRHLTARLPGVPGRIGGGPTEHAAGLPRLSSGRRDADSSDDQCLVVDVLPLILAGELSRAMDVAVAAYERALAAVDAWSASLAAALVGRLHLAAGRAEHADLFLREALLDLPPDDRRGYHAWCLATRAHALGLVGDQARAEALLVEAAAAPSASNRLLEAEVGLAHAWVAASRGETSRAAELAASAAEMAGRSDQPLSALVAWHDVARLGSAQVAAERVSTLPHLPGRLAEVVVSHIGALAADDPDAIAGCVDPFEEIGADLVAAETAAAAAAAYQRAGRPARGRALQWRAQRLLARCGAARTPALRGLDATPWLTRRQREVAFLAAEGLASREIAARLGVSTRTVDNHLQHVYTTLGLSGRADLADVLGPLTPAGDAPDGAGRANEGEGLAHLLDAAERPDT